jgi:hypothetical protein
MYKRCNEMHESTGERGKGANRRYVPRYIVSAIAATGCSELIASFGVQSAGGACTGRSVCIRRRGSTGGG